MSALRAWVDGGSLRWRRIDQFRRLELELLALGAVAGLGWLAMRW